MIRFDDFYSAKFIGTKEYCGFITNTDYTVKVVENRPYGLTLIVLGDDEFYNECPYCNIKSIERVWRIKHE